DTDDLFVGKTLLHGHVLMWLMKTLLTSRCINQLGAGHLDWLPVDQYIVMLTMSAFGTKQTHIAISLAFIQCSLKPIVRAEI
ncbi:hypothetical protein, partial [Klebsiella pneumoniae]|uniref:hypothetical protein n=1 Tax=Klebsiella pneumoniae TaxID=573 RepID=UPI001D0DA879